MNKCFNMSYVFPQYDRFIYNRYGGKMQTKDENWN